MQKFGFKVSSKIEFDLCKGIWSLILVTTSNSFVQGTKTTQKSTCHMLTRSTAHA